MSLRRSFFLLSVVCLAAALLLTAGVYMACKRLIYGIPSGGVAISFDGVVTNLEEPSQRQRWILEWLSVIPLLAALVFPVCGLGLAGAFFYRWKLKEPIRILKEGTERIRLQGLDFTIAAVSEDELGKLCAAFEMMRRELQRTNQALWRQAEERRRLHAAFSHDLRNPVTVLKGTVKLLRQDVEDAAGREQALQRLETYTLRIERYVEAMSSIQRLEQMPVCKKRIEGTVLRQELEETAALHKSPPLISVLAQGVTEVNVDHGIFLTVAENLIGNGVRFAKREVKIYLRQEGRRLTLTVWDDGPGYPAWLVKEGPRPFGRAEEEAAYAEKDPEDTMHFGMGLYSSQVLLGKHGGELRLENGRLESFLRFILYTLL